MKRVVSFLIAMALLAMPAAAQEDEAAPPQTIDQLRIGFEAILSESEVVGAQIAIIEDGEVTFTFNYGEADRDAGTPVTDRTVFRAGSISKSFVGVMFMRAVEDGLVALDDHVADVLPDVEFINPWEETDPITFAHVMEHTAGFYDIGVAEFLYSNPETSITEGLALNPRNRVSRWRPGTYYSYANMGPPMAALAVERARGTDYDELVRRELLRPLGMPGSDLELTDTIEQRISQSYSPGLETPIPYYHILMRPSGALNTTATELSQFVRMMINRGELDGTQYLSPESVDRIERSETLEAVEFYGLDGTYGLGNDSQFTRTRVMRGHGGAIDGFVASYSYDPEQRVGWVILSNTDDGGAMFELQTLAASYLYRSFTPDLPGPFPMDRAMLAEYAGFYESVTPRSRHMATFLPIASLVSPTRVTYSDDTGLVVAGVRRIPNGEYTMRRPERAESSFALAYDSAYRRQLRYSNQTLVQLSPLDLAARIIFIGGLALGAALIVLYEPLAIATYVVRRVRGTAPSGRRGPRFMRVYGWLTAASLVGVAVILGNLLSRHFTTLEVLTTPNELTVAVFALTLTAPLFAALSLWTAAFVPGDAGRFNRTYHGIAAALILGGCLWLAQYGWLGLQLWRF